MRVWKGQDTDEFWLPLISGPDGELIREKVLDELYDYSVLMENASEVYCHATGGRIGNLLTEADVVKSIIDDETSKECKDSYDEGYSAGYENGCWDGKIDGVKEGYAEGYEKGSGVGYLEGVEWCKRVAEQYA